MKQMLIRVNVKDFKSLKKYFPKNKRESMTKYFNRFVTRLTTEQLIPIQEFKL